MDYPCPSSPSGRSLFFVLWWNGLLKGYIHSKHRFRARKAGSDILLHMDIAEEYNVALRNPVLKLRRDVAVPLMRGFAKVLMKFARFPPNPSSPCTIEVTHSR